MNLTTEQTTVHTLRLSPHELEALRHAATHGLAAAPGSAYAETWQAFARLGKGATRSLTDVPANPALTDSR